MGLIDGAVPNDFAGHFLCCVTFPTYPWRCGRWLCSFRDVTQSATINRQGTAKSVLLTFADSAIGIQVLRHAVANNGWLKQVLCAWDRFCIFETVG